MNKDIKEFIDNDYRYLNWIENNPTGLVVNCNRYPNSNYLKLHRATCGTITTVRRKNWTIGDYKKICSMEKRELEKWAEIEVNGKLTSCKLCNP